VKKCFQGNQVIVNCPGQKPFVPENACEVLNVLAFNLRYQGKRQGSEKIIQGFLVSLLSPGRMALDVSKEVLFELTTFGLGKVRPLFFHATNTDIEARQGHCQE
jgi:hypothetical protein